MSSTSLNSKNLEKAMKDMATDATSKVAKKHNLKASKTSKEISITGKKKDVDNFTKELKSSKKI